MKWDRLEREITAPMSSGLYVVQRCIGWECSHCHHINWADRRPNTGCWVCGQRDEQYGNDAVLPQNVHSWESLKL